MILACPCGKKFKLPPEKAAKLKPGSHFKCTGCGHDIPIPTGDTGDEPPTVIMPPPAAPAATPRSSVTAVAPTPAPPAADDEALKERVQELSDLLDMERKMFSEELDHLKEENRLLQARLEEQEKAAAESGRADDRLNLMQKERAALADEVKALTARAEQDAKEIEGLGKDLREAEAALAEPKKRADELEARVRELEAAQIEAAQPTTGRGAEHLEELVRCAAALLDRMDPLSESVAALRRALEQASQKDANQEEPPAVTPPAASPSQAAEPSLAPQPAVPPM